MRLMVMTVIAVTAVMAADDPAFRIVMSFFALDA